MGNRESGKRISFFALSCNFFRTQQCHTKQRYKAATWDQTLWTHTISDNPPAGSALGHAAGCLWSSSLFESSGRKTFHPLLHLSFQHPQIPFLAVQSIPLHPVGSLVLVSTQETALQLFLSGHQWFPEGQDSPRSSAAGLSWLNVPRWSWAGPSRPISAPGPAPAAPLTAEPLLCAAGKSLHVPSSQPLSCLPSPSWVCRYQKNRAVPWFSKGSQIYSSRTCYWVCESAAPDSQSKDWILVLCLS